MTALGVLLALAGCAGDGADTAGPEDLAATLPASGAWGVGYVEDEITYADAVDGGERTMRTAIWYPSNEDTSGDDVGYLSGLLTREGVKEGAAVADGPHPLAIFSHGHQGFAEAAAFQMAHLASHGWLVVAPEHTSDTSFDDPDRKTAIYLQRPLDISAALDWLESSDWSYTDTTVAIGHSFGGYTLFALAGATYDPDAIAACYESDDEAGYCSTMSAHYEALLLAGFAEERIDAFLPMAAGDIDRFGGGVEAVDAPFLLMNGELDNDDADAYWAALEGRGDNLRVEIVGGGHNTFTEFSDTLMVEDGQTLAVDAWPPILAYTLAWARYHDGDDSVLPVLDGEIAISDYATLSR